METKTHKTALVVIPPDQAWGPIQAIRREHDRNIHRWMPHITLLYPFRPVEQFDVLADSLARVCATMDPFEITLAEFRFFRHNSRSFTLWLAPDPRPLQRLQDPAPRIGNVALIARNNVEMQVEDGLPGGLAHVDPDVETVGMISTNDLLPHPVDRLNKGGLLLAGGLKPGRDMPAGDNQCVPRRHREAVPKCDDQRIFVEDAIPCRFAKWAGCHDRDPDSEEILTSRDRHHSA